ncbi:T9SS type A sorting domain-containing protein [Flammeovirga aprica]|uniref:T9SS type A sorting domain-containing protein n=1 Tax=Flammeovirga aprica JL-4 TaxID=694437 RepID=A0A7X9XC43_9BACT|nr:T9SS type A sorting domain-containing protein [Flammeovirga aprica]NME71353.1 T9SS type A sorting domain-containing protein [Flammeovirga aprica JL-4]
MYKFLPTQLITLVFITTASFASFAQTINSIIDQDITIGGDSWPEVSSSTGDVQIKQGVPFNTTVTFDHLDGRGGNNNDMKYYSVIEGDLIIDAGQTVIIEQSSYLVVNGNLTINGTVQFNNHNGNTKHVYLIVLGEVNGTGTIAGGLGTHDKPPYATDEIIVQGDHKGGSGYNIDDLDAYIVDILRLNGYDLPVELISFTASQTNNAIALNWSTASEMNASHFEVYSSIDNKNWEFIGEVDANGNSNTRIDYSFYDEKEYNSTVYYKLVQYDFDGKSETFGPLVVHSNTSENNFHTSVFPNPSTNGKASLQISGMNLGATTTIQLINKEGKAVLYDTIDNQDITSTVYEIGDKVNLKSGFYILKINSGTSQKTEKLIIQ